MNAYYLPAMLMATALVGCNGSSGESGSEGPEGSEGTGTPLTSTGVNRGIEQSITLAKGDSWAGLMNGMELAVAYDPAKEQFVGRIKNETGAGTCDANVEILLDAWQTASGAAISIPNLASNASHSFVVPATGATFTDWVAKVDTFTCNGTGTPVSSGEGAEGSGGTGEGSEGAGHNETGGGEGAEGGTGMGSEETSPSIPLNQPYAGTLNNLDFSFAYDGNLQAFTGVVENKTAQTVCASRVEIHLGAGTQVLELGPTIGFNLSAGEALDVVLTTGGLATDTWTLHPESSLCTSADAAASI